MTIALLVVMAPVSNRGIDPGSDRSAHPDVHRSVDGADAGRGIDGEMMGRGSDPRGIGPDHRIGRARLTALHSPGHPGRPLNLTRSELSCPSRPSLPNTPAKDRLTPGPARSRADPRPVTARAPSQAPARRPLRPFSSILVILFSFVSVASTFMTWNEDVRGLRIAGEDDTPIPVNAWGQLVINLDGGRF